MCKWNTTTKIKLAYPRECSGITEVYVDSCISEVVQELNNLKIHTLSCCCGHNKSNPSLVISDSYSYNDVQKILNIIKTIDERNWEICQWELRITGKCKEGIVNESSHFVTKADKL